MQEHNERVSRISSQVRSFYERGETYRIYHGTTSTTRRVKLSIDFVVDTSRMTHVLKVDAENLLALVEPNVSMEQLVDTTLPYGVIPPVVMEFPAITVGGGFAGTAGESSSFRYGLFDKTISRIEIVLANGDVMEASRHEHADLLDAAAGSFGTLGVITLLEIQLVKAQPYVELTFRIIGGMEEAVKTIECLTASLKSDYIEGIMFGIQKGLIISGKLTDDPDTKLQLSQYSRPRDPWFYLRAEQVLEDELEEFRELVPLRDYLFRYDRGTFWAGKYAFRYFVTPFNNFTRWALDSLTRNKVMYHALHKSHLADQYIVQDIGFPYATVGRFVEYLDRRFGFYPLWLCPLKVAKDMSLRPRHMPAFDPDARSPGMMINVGLWGPGPKQYHQFVAANREIEHKTAELGGLKCFYAQAFYTPDEFWALYDKAWYDNIRAKYHALGLLSVCEKINIDFKSELSPSNQSWRGWLFGKFKEQWPVRGVYGVLQVLISREYLLAK